MATGRIPALLALGIALALGLAPWRVCAHADEQHARVYVLGLTHAHDHDHDHAAATAPTSRAGRSAGRGAHAHKACGPGCRTHGAGEERRRVARDHGHAHRHDGALHGDGARCRHLPRPGHAHAPAGRSTHAHPAAHGHHHAHPEGHCHCGDHPLVPGLALTPVTLDALAASGAALTVVAALVTAPGTLEVVPAARPRAWRIACEEDPIVLLR